jgi:Glycosyltransferase sugar-binding region containing DXD motif
VVVTVPIVQYWDSNPPPEQVAELLATFGAKNPDMSHRIFSEPTAERFIEAYYGRRELEAFRACGLPAMQADYFRYCAVLALGGIYADADYRCLGSLRPLVEGCESGHIFFNHTARIAQQVINGFFVFPAPGHPLLRLALDVATANIETRLAERVWPVGAPVHQAVGFTTGPGIFSFLYFLWALGSFEALIEGWSGRKLEPFALTMRDVAGDYERIAEAFDGVRISPYEEMMGWVGLPDRRLAYKSTEAFWMNASMPIFR